MAAIREHLELIFVCDPNSENRPHNLCKSGSPSNNWPALLYSETYDWFQANRRYVEVLQLPPYWPELNATERICNYTRKHDLAGNLYYAGANSQTPLLGVCGGCCSNCFNFFLQQHLFLRVAQLGKKETQFAIAWSNALRLLSAFSSRVTVRFHGVLIQSNSLA